MAIEEPAPTGDEEKPPAGQRHDVSKVFGIFKWHGPPVTIEEMQAAIEDGAVARYRRAVGADIPADDEA